MRLRQAGRDRAHPVGRLADAAWASMVRWRWRCERAAVELGWAASLLVAPGRRRYGRGLAVVALTAEACHCTNSLQALFFLVVVVVV